MTPPLDSIEAIYDRHGELREEAAGIQRRRDRVQLLEQRGCMTALELYWELVVLDKEAADNEADRAKLERWML